jgi:hypothetical protein
MFPSPGFYIRTVLQLLRWDSGDFRFDDYNTTSLPGSFGRLQFGTGRYYTLQFSIAKTLGEDFYSLMLAVNRFIQRDLNLKSGQIFDGSVGIQGRLLESAQRLCTDNFEQLDVKSSVKLPVHIFRRLIISLEIMKRR